MRNLVLCSGGVKSTFLAVEAAKEGEALLLHLTHAHPSQAMEEKAARKIARFCSANIVVKRTEGLPPLVEPLLRFFGFFCWAVPVARAEQCSTIYYGLSRDDLSFIHDPKTAEEFITGLQNVVHLCLPKHMDDGKWLGSIEIDTPLRRLTLKHVIRLGNEWRINWEETWSCEKAGSFHCGICSKCKRRKRAFLEEGSVDPTFYSNDHGVFL